MRCNKNSVKRDTYNPRYLQAIKPSLMRDQNIVIRCHKVGSRALTVCVLSGPRASSILVKGNANLSFHTTLTCAIFTYFFLGICLSFRIKCGFVQVVLSVPFHYHTPEAFATVPKLQVTLDLCLQHWLLSHWPVLSC